MDSVQPSPQQRNKKGNTMIDLADVRELKDALAALMSTERAAALAAAESGNQARAEYCQGRADAFELAARFVFELPGFTNAA
jgi:hypothetical protein